MKSNTVLKSLLLAASLFAVTTAEAGGTPARKSGRKSAVAETPAPGRQRTPSPEGNEASDAEVIAQLKKQLEEAEAAGNTSKEKIQELEAALASSKAEKTPSEAVASVDPKCPLKQIFGNVFAHLRKGEIKAAWLAFDAKMNEMIENYNDVEIVHVLKQIKSFVYNSGSTAKQHYIATAAVLVVGMVFAVYMVTPAGQLTAVMMSPTVFFETVKTLVLTSLPEQAGAVWTGAYGFLEGNFKAVGSMYFLSKMCWRVKEKAAVTA